MKIRYSNNKYLSTLLFLVIASFTWATDGFCAQVDEAEAVAVADLWYAMEINSKYIDLEPAEKAARIADVKNREVLYLISKDELQNTPPKDRNVLAYIVKYQPNGFVVVSGEDRIDPILVFNAEGTFRFDQPDRNYMPHYLTEALVGRWEDLLERLSKGTNPPVHDEWSSLRTKLRNCRDLSSAVATYGSGGGSTAGCTSIYVLLDVPTWGQGYPSNYKVNSMNMNPYMDIPTGCVATAMAMKMRYHEWPPKGIGAHGYDDVWGNTQYYHSVDYSAQTYDWADMPMGPITKKHDGVSDLMYHCGVSVDMDYEVGISLAYGKDAPVAMEKYFQHIGHSWNSSNHEPGMITSIRGGLPVFMTYPKHAMLVHGYRDTGSTYFYVNLGWDGGSNNWYNLNNINGNVIDDSAPFSQPTGWVYVKADASGTTIGLLQKPYKTLAYANSVVPDGGQLWLHEGTHPVPSGGIDITKRLTICNYIGPVWIK